MTDLSVVHLVWAPLGNRPIETFVRAYRQHAAGCDHKLVIALNGFADDAARAVALDLFAGVEHDVVVIPRPIQDIAAYRIVADQLTSEYVCFLNSYSEPLDNGWLAKLATHVRRPDVGLVGASGSWQTLYDWLMGQAWPAESRPRTWHPRRWAGWVRRMAQRRAHIRRIDRDFRPFPNRHVRSNAFALRRQLFRELQTGPLRTKTDAYVFENGRRSMTEQILARGLRTLIVGRDGVGYEPDAWPTSRIYRSGDQENLLVADNQTRLYDTLAERERLRHETWGDD